jgi:periplasmic protein TonB
VRDARALFVELEDREQRSPWRAALFSLTGHALIFAAIALLVYRTPRPARFTLPGTARGTMLLTYYSPGSAQAPKASTPVRRKTAVPAKLSLPKAVAAPVAPAAPSSVDSGPGSSAESGAGQGDISIALLQHFLNPRPDLTTLPHGTAGDVVLNAVIDERGRIAELTLLKGLAPAIDEAVMATVKGWTFTPATRNGVPVASEQELHFHYQRG